MTFGSVGGAASGFFLRRLTRLTVAATAVALVMCGFASQSFGSFGPASDFAVGIAPQSVEIGNFDGNASADLAVANASSNNVSVLLGDGTGSFNAATSFAVGLIPRSVSIGDFNGDGFSDLVVSNEGSNSVSVLLGNGSGSFGAATSFTVGTKPQSVSIGNLNGDGFADLAVANRDTANVSVLLGNGDGSFGAATNFNAGSNPFSIVVGKLNDDNFADIAVANFGGSSISVLLGKGDGTFGSQTLFAAGLAPWSLTVGDLNGDGSADLAIADTAQSVGILSGNGSGSFGTFQTLPSGSQPRGVRIGNLNGDAFPDLAVVNYASENEVSVLLGDGPGSFGTATTYSAGGYPTSIAIGDLDDDSIADLAVTHLASGKVSVLLNNAPTATAEPASLAFQPAIEGAPPEARSITVTNSSGGDPMSVSGISIIGPHAGDFALTGESCSPEPLPLSGTCSVQLAFSPFASGPRNAELEVRYDGGAPPLTVPLSGTVATPRIGTFRVMGPRKVRKGKTVTYKARISSSGNAPAEGVRLTASGRGIRGRKTVGRIDAGATRTISLRLRPARSGRVKATFKATSSNAGSKTVKKKITVRK